MNNGRSSRLAPAARVVLIVLLSVSFLGLLRYARRPATSPVASNRSEHEGVLAETASVAIGIDGTVSHQVMEGFGASTDSSASCGIDQMGAIRPQILDAVYNQVKLTMGDIHCAPYEAVYPNGGCGWEAQQRQSDNNDPNVFNWSGFDWSRSDYDKTALVDLAQPMGFNNYSLRGGISTRWADQWLNDIRSQNYNLYLQEAAENAVVILVHWRDRYGIVPRWHQLFNEPLNGNNEVYGASLKEIVDLVKATGARFRAEGFENVKLVVPSDADPIQSLETAKAILNDPQARQYVGAISYHPYGGTYNYISSIFATSGKGNPDSDAINIRAQIRDLARQYGLQVWMTEVSGGGAETEFDLLRGRAIHIHDELTYADASSFWGMWSAYSLNGHGVSEDSVVLFDPSAQTYRITGMGRALGHYARWIKKGAVRVECASSDPLLQVTAFRDSAQGRFVLVAINNDSIPKSLNVSVKGLGVSGTLVGEQSTAGAYWQALDPFAPTDSSSFSITVPALSVTTVAASLNPSSGPRITEASISGKKLFVTGENFDVGAVILMNGDKQKTSNDEQSATTRLIGKKAGKWISPGQTVKLQVRNSDGTLSPELSFRRPD